METKQNKKVPIYQNIGKILCIAAMIAMSIIAVFVYGASVGQVLIMTVFFVLYVQLPGMLIMKATGIKLCHYSTNLAVGTFTGWAFSILAYFISDLIGTEVVMLICGPILSLIYIITIASGYRSGKMHFRKFRFSDISLAFLCFMAIVLLYCLMETQYLYLSPEISDFTYMNPDKAYHMGLINSLSHDYPIQSPWIRGVTIHYHVFSEMMLSIPVRLFGVEADVATQSFGPYLTAYTFGISYYSLFKELTSKSKRAGLYCLLVLLSNIYVTRRISSSIAYKFILVNDNSSGYGLAAVLVTIIVFNKWYQSFKEGNRNHIKILLLCTALVMLTTGIKGPMGAVVLLGIWGTILLGILLRRIPIKTVLPVVLVTIGFAIVYIEVLGSKGQSNASGSSIIAFAKIVDIAFWKKPLISIMKSMGVPLIIRYGVMIFAFMVFFLSIFFVPFCIGYIRELIMVLGNKKEYNPGRVLVYAAFAVGLSAMFLLNYSGHSQIYFGLVSAFLAPVIAFWFIEDLEEMGRESQYADSLLGTCVIIMVASLVFTSGTFIAYMGRHLSDSVTHADPHANSSMYLSVSKSEYEAMEWLEDNTEEDALLATDRYYSVDPKDYSYENRWDNRFFLYGVYSNRFSYIGGSGYNMRQADWPIRKRMIETNKQLYDEKNENRGDLARELGVDYVVVSKRFTGTANLENKDYKLCYSNDDVDIYKIVE